MNIETKTIYGPVDEYLKFGWSYTEDVSVRSGRSSHIEHVLARDKDMPNHRLIAALEEKYFALKAKKKYYEGMDPLYSFLFFLMLILPFFIYWAFKSAQKANIEEYNDNLQKQMDSILQEVKPLL